MTAYAHPNPWGAVQHRPRKHHPASGLVAMTRGGRHGHHRHEGPGPFGGPPFGPPGFGFGGPGGPRGRGRRRRGDVRGAILLLLDEQPRNGYGLMQELEERSAGAWRPSPGSIYPALAQLEDEGLVAPSTTEGETGKTFTLTDAGRAHVEEHRERLGSPWDDASAGIPAGVGELRQAGGQVAMAAMQVAQTGNAKLIDEARKILGETRRSLYRLLADAED
jgi:DNA-binding PadR family transcriptional regulator